MCSLSDRIQKVCEEVLRRVTPSREEKIDTLRFVNSLIEKLRCKLEKLGLEAEVCVEGSIAKDTWIAGEKDIDLFMLVPKEYGKEAFQKVLEAAKDVCKGRFLEAYAEHPYIHAEMEGFTIDFVPCFKLERAEEAISSVDRTPFHTTYVKKHLKPEGRREVRLLKRFMRGIGTYGAEIKIGGFSGYLCELLVMYYGSFLNVLKAASNWRGRILIDIENHYRGRAEEALKIFDQPLIVIDPVDKNRNVASAVNRERLAEFIAASRLFIKNPSVRFFFPPELKPFSTQEAIEKMRSKGTSFVFLKTEAIKAVPDVLWGQLYKSQRALKRLILRYDFEVLRDTVWSDEKTSTVFIFELKSHTLPAAKKHIGPPIAKKMDCERFLKKHLSSKMLVSGPRIEGDRWVVEKKRRYRNASSLLKDFLKDGGRSVGVASLVSEAFSSSLEVIVNEEIMDFYLSNEDFASFFTTYLIGKPMWLQ